MRKYSTSSKDLLCLKEDFIKNNSQLYDNESLDDEAS